MNKRCYKCQVEKPTTEFQKVVYGFQSNCKTCEVKRVKAARSEFKRACVEYKGGKCISCGYNKSMVGLDFHHVDAKMKDFTINRAVGTKLNQKVKDELDKCVILCAVCHREEHERLDNLS